MLLAVAIDLINNLIALPMLSRGMAAQGLVVSPIMLLLSVVTPPALGLVFWYCIARRASVIAKWLMVAFVALAVAVFAFQMIGAPLASGNPMLMAAVVAELLKIYAVFCLFLPAARPWFRKEDIA